MTSSNVATLPLVLEYFQLSQEYPEFYLEGAVLTDLPKSSVSIIAKGEKQDYPAILYYRGENALRFRTRIPAQSFSFRAQVDGVDAPVQLLLPDLEPIARWKEVFAFEKLPGIGVYVPTPTGFDLVRSNPLWLAKRRLLRMRNHLDPQGIETLRFWDKDEERESHTREQKNRCILGVPSMPASPQRVNLEYWRPADNAANLGDYLSQIVCDWMLQKRGLSFDTPVAHTQFLAAVGSIVGMGCNDITVWGSGLLWAKCPRFISPETKELDIRAVRGPETRRLLVERGYDCPKTFGDPAVLLPLIYQPAAAEKTRDHLVICHIFDQEDSDVNIATADYEGFVDQVVSARLVISSSLHGIILAESYGVPAILIDDCRPDFSLHKYRDWYLSTGRTAFPVAHTIQEALAMTPPPLPDLADMQQQLMEVFPYDLWE